MTRSKLLRSAASLAVGGTTFAWLDGGACQNAATRGLARDVGIAAIGEAAAGVGEGIDEHANAIVVEPLAAFLQNLFAAWVNLNIPADPTYDRLLVE